MGITKNILKYSIIILIILFVFTANYILVKTQDKSDKKSSKNTCIESGCHEMVMRGWYKHSPVKDDCTSCHTYLKGKHPEDKGREFELSAKVPDLCLTCHDLTKGDKSKHFPVTEGECLTCHDQHSSDQRNLLNLYNGKTICIKCHDVTNKDMLVIHGPVKNNECSKCHEPHNSKFAKLLRSEEDKLCLTCHNKQIKQDKENPNLNRTIPDISQKLKSQTIHPPASSGCTDCHAPHGSKNQKLIKSDYPIGSYVYDKDKVGLLCFTCHSKDNLDKKNPDATGFRNEKTNLHSVHVNKEKSRNCIICHDMHGSENLHLIKELSSFGKWQLPINYISNETGGTCTPGCHEQKTYKNK